MMLNILLNSMYKGMSIVVRLLELFVLYAPCQIFAWSNATILSTCVCIQHTWVHRYICYAHNKRVFYKRKIINGVYDLLHKPELESFVNRSKVKLWSIRVTFIRVSRNCTNLFCTNFSLIQTMNKIVRILQGLLQIFFVLRM